jgi:hypothetical protein
MTESKKNNKNKTITKVNKNTKSNNKSTTPKRKYKTPKIPKMQKGGDTDICKKDINELLTTNKKIYTYNNSGIADGKSLSGTANILASDTVNDWGRNPGAPPDPNSCVIL